MNNRQYNSIGFDEITEVILPFMSTWVLGVMTVLSVYAIMYGPYIVPIIGWLFVVPCSIFFILCGWGTCLGLIEWVRLRRGNPLTKPQK